jgi:hypothetical protein
VAIWNQKARRDVHRVGPRATFVFAHHVETSREHVRGQGSFVPDDDRDRPTDWAARSRIEDVTDPLSFNLTIAL